MVTAPTVGWGSDRTSTGTLTSGRLPEAASSTLSEISNTRSAKCWAVSVFWGRKHRRAGRLFTVPWTSIGGPSQQANARSRRIRAPFPSTGKGSSTAFERPRSAAISPIGGGLLSVALSLGSPPPDVIRHRISVEPGLSSALARGGRPADWPGRHSGCGAGRQPAWRSRPVACYDRGWPAPVRCRPHGLSSADRHRMPQALGADLLRQELLGASRRMT